MTTSADILARIDSIRRNPQALVRLGLDMVESAYAGTLDIGNATLPLVQGIEVSAVNAAACMVHGDSIMRKMYPTLAVNSEELYRHMSNADYIDRFASPAKATITFLLGKEEVIAMAVPTESGGMSKLTIPRHTSIKVNGAVYTMQYPIDIRVMAHSGLQIVYDASSPSPVQTLETNLVNWEVYNMQGMEVLAIHVPMYQMEVVSRQGTANNTSSFVNSWTFTDQFYFARAYYKDAQNRWREMITTHTDQVFDPFKPTALLKIIENRVQMQIPQIYTSSGLVGGEFRLDVYTTKGPMDVDLAEFVARDFSAEFVDLEGNDDPKYWAPITQLRYRGYLANSKVTGGSYQLSFEETRERMINNAAGPQVLPITDAQLTARLERLGYGSVLYVDNVTQRQYKATRSLPPPADGSTTSAAACTIQMLTMSMAQLAKHETVRDNGDRLTILPDTLYHLTSGLVEVVPKTVADSINQLPIDVRARRINDTQYLYSPFHYVLDKTSQRFEHRPYYLNDPKIISKSFVEENDTTGMQVTASAYSIERVPEGYHLTVILQSSDNWKAIDDEDVFVQLSFIPDGQRDRAYVAGQLLGEMADERVYLFELTTDYDIDADHNLFLTSFQMYADEARPHGCGLLTDFDLVYAARNLEADDLQASNIDTVISRVLAPDDAMGISRETLRIQLGEAMEGMWASSRSVASSEDYERWDVDVPALYETTELKRDAQGGLVFEPDAEGNPQPVVLWRKGDVQRDDQGNVLYQWSKGDVKIDPVTKLPIVKSTRTLLRQMDMLFLDGVYWFATESAAVAYRDYIPRTIMGWLREDINYLTKFLLEKTRLFLYPKSTYGQVQAVVREGQESSIRAAQTFNVEFYLNATAYRDAALRATLSKLAVDTIAEVLTQPTVTLNTIISRLTARAGTDIVAVTVTGLGGTGTSAQPSVTMVDESARLSIRRIAVALADGTIGVEDDVNIAFVQHTE